MARGFIVSSFSPSAYYPSPAIKTTTSVSTKVLSRLFPPTNPWVMLLLPLSVPCSSPFQLSCKSAYSSMDIAVQKEAFAKRMAMAGIKPYHRLALGVSGGPDSMALCVLASQWKLNSAGSAAAAVRDDKRGFVDGLLAIIVDHGLRPESREEAEMVSCRVSDLGIRCEIAQANWSNGHPKQGHIQEAARDMRYQIFYNVCHQHQIGVLLVAHHADDQAELFILRLSRNSGLLGLAGMAFASQLYSSLPFAPSGSSENQGILLVRPLLDLSKEDLYEVCKRAHKKWVEDPTNQSHKFARNRIRMKLQEKSSCTFKSELQKLISNCRKTRAYVDFFCRRMINQAVETIDHGYIVVDLVTLDAANKEDIFLSKFLSSVLQFISQRHRPIRGSALRLLLDYIRTFPCKTSLTASGCYLCPAPGTKGTKLIVCCSVQSLVRSPIEVIPTCGDDVICHKIPAEVDEIISEGKSHQDRWTSDAIDVKLLNAVSSEKLLDEAKRLNIISEKTYQCIIDMKIFEAEHFRSNSESTSSNESHRQEGSVNSSVGEILFHPGQCCYFMNRFLITWTKPSKRRSNLSNDVSFKDDHPGKEEEETRDSECGGCCVVSDDMSAKVCPMVEADWLTLARISKSSHDSVEFQGEQISADSLDKPTMKNKSSSCSDYAKLSALQALQALKSIPAAARRGLPILVSAQGVLLSIPSIGFKSCPCLMVSAEFKSRVPLGGGREAFNSVTTSVEHSAANNQEESLAKQVEHDGRSSDDVDYGLPPLEMNTNRTRPFELHSDSESDSVSD